MVVICLQQPPNCSQTSGSFPNGFLRQTAESDEVGEPGHGSLYLPLPHYTDHSQKTGDFFNFYALSPDGEGPEITTKARVDRKLPINLISRSRAIATCIQFNACSSSVRVEDSEGKVYEPSSFIVLRWAVINVPKTYDNRFYVVDGSPYDVVLGAGAPGGLTD